MVLLHAPSQVIERWRELGVSRESIARALGVDVRTLERWSTGRSYPQHAARAGLETLAALNAHLLDVFDGSSAAADWLDTESRYLAGLKPVHVLEAGRADRVEAALEAIESGIFL
ncbi:MAG: antitoxin Xre/MbcA/ParS toxin-binding domain-containing protein [Dehalococcoidia bacterium]